MPPNTRSVPLHPGVLPAPKAGMNTARILLLVLIVVTLVSCTAAPTKAFLPASSGQPSTPTPLPVKSATPAPTLTPIAPPTVTQTRTPTLTLTPTPFFTATITLTPTVAITQIDGAECIPGNHLAQVAWVVKVVDGDTIDVRLEDGSIVPLRYIGIDAPERDAPHSEAATDFNTQLVLEKQVILIKDVSETDPNDRLLRYVLVNNIFVNREMVRLGLALAKEYPPDTACAGAFAAAQSDAQAGLLGLWAATPTPDSSLAQIIIVTVDKVAEFVDIKNVSAAEINLVGWRLVSEKGNQSCSLSGSIAAGETLRIWANNSQGGGYNCGFGKNIWNNSEPDPAVLYNPQGVEVSRK